MNSNNSNTPYNSCHNINNMNSNKLRFKRPYGALQSNYQEWYTPNSKKFKHCSNQTDCNQNILAFNSDSKKNAVVFSSFSNDVEMSSQSQNHSNNTAASTESKIQAYKK